MRRRELRASEKSLLVAGGIAALFLVAWRWLARDPANAQLAAIIRDWLGFPVKLAALGATLAGRQEGFGRVEGYLLGPALGWTGAVVLAVVLCGAVRVPVRGRSVIDRLWPGALTYKELVGREAEVTAA